MGNLPCLSACRDLGHWRGRFKSPRGSAPFSPRGSAPFRRRESDQIKRLVSATCLARLTVPSVSAIIRLAASSLLMVSRADLTIIGWPLGPTARACMAVGLMVGLTVAVFALELLV